MRNSLIAAALAVPLLAVGVAEASCRIDNTTKYTFTIQSGNVSNQRVGSNTITTIAAGQIVAKSDDGKTASGSCSDGDEIKIVEQGGAPIIVKK